VLLQWFIVSIKEEEDRYVDPLDDDDDDDDQ
jgi:hypothetical protein